MFLLLFNTISLITLQYIHILHKLYFIVLLSLVLDAYLALGISVIDMQLRHLIKQAVYIITNTVMWYYLLE